MNTENHNTEYKRICGTRSKVMEISKRQYEYALDRIEELLPRVTDETLPTDKEAIELAIKWRGWIALYFNPRAYIRN
jgi:hypothetical protein